MLFNLNSWGRFMRAAATGLLFSAVSISSAAAEEFPKQNIEFVVPYAAGGPLDTMARMLAEKAKPHLGNIYVENKPGAGGNIGAGYVAKAKPDGHTLVMGAVAINAINPWLYETLPFDPIKSFEPVTLVASVPNVLVLNPEFAAKNNINSVADLIEHAKNNAGVLNYGSGGNGSAGHLAGELLNTQMNIDTVHIPYAGAAPAKMALMSGEIDYMFDNLASAAGLISGGKANALAVTTESRSFMLPELPTMQESGVENFDLGTWFGVFATGGTPDNVVQQLNAAYVKALNDPDVRKAINAMGSDAKPNSSAEFAKFVSAELAKYESIVKASGAKAQ